MAKLKTADEIRAEIATTEARDDLAEVLDRARERSRIRHWDMSDRKRARWQARWSAKVAPGVSGVVYAAAVGTAVHGQVSTAEHLFGWHWYAGLGMAAFIEMAALSAAKTAHDIRMEAAWDGRYEPALLPRVLTWGLAGFASVVNAYAHEAIPLEAAVMGAASLVGIVVWEMRNTWPLRRVLLAQKLVPAHLPRLGAKYSARFPIQAFDAKSASLASPSVSTRDEAIEAGAVRRSSRRPWRMFGRRVWGWWRTDGPSGQTITGRADGRDNLRVDGRASTGADDHAGAGGRTDGVRVETVRADELPLVAVDGRTDGTDATADGPSSENGPSTDRPSDRAKPRDYLAEVRPVYRHMVVNGDRITRDALGAELRDRGISVPNAQIGKVLTTLREEMPAGSEQGDMSPEAAEAAV